MHKHENNLCVNKQMDVNIVMKVISKITLTQNAVVQKGCQKLDDVSSLLNSSLLGYFFYQQENYVFLYNQEAIE